MTHPLDAERRDALWRTILWIAVLGVAHFALGTRTHAVHGLHIFFAGLFLVPVLIASGSFGTRGGLLAALASGLVYLAHLLWSWRDSPLANADQFGMIGVYFVVALAAGRLVAIAEWRKDQRDEVIRRSNATQSGEGSVPR
jgi:hypothetical protein